MASSTVGIRSAHLRDEAPDARDGPDCVFGKGPRALARLGGLSLAKSPLPGIVKCAVRAFYAQAQQLGGAGHNTTARASSGDGGM